MANVYEEEPPTLDVPTNTFVVKNETVTKQRRVEPNPQLFKIVCTICGVKICKVNMKRHVLQKHAEVPPIKRPRKKRTVLKLHQCPECIYTNTRYANVKRHIDCVHLRQKKTHTSPSSLHQQSNQLVIDSTDVSSPTESVENLQLKLQQREKEISNLLNEKNSFVHKEKLLVQKLEQSKEREKKNEFKINVLLEMNKAQAEEKERIIKKDKKRELDNAKAEKIIFNKFSTLAAYVANLQEENEKLQAETRIELEDVPLSKEPVFVTDTNVLMHFHKLLFEIIQNHGSNIKIRFPQIVVAELDRLKTSIKPQEAHLARLALKNVEKLQAMGAKVQNSEMAAEVRSEAQNLDGNRSDWMVALTANQYAKTNARVILFTNDRGLRIMASRKVIKFDPECGYNHLVNQINLQ